MITLDEDLQCLQRKNEVHTPRLAAELIREIVETAAVQSQPTASNLALVCKDTHLWVMPIVFRTITLDWSEKNKRDLVKTIADTSHTLANHVRNLRLAFAHDFSASQVVSSDFSVESYNEVALLALGRCAHVERLVISYWDPHDSLDKLSNIGTFSGLWDLRIIPSNLFRFIKHSNLPYLRNVTHFYYGYEDFCDGRGKLLSTLLPNVTHLAFSVLNFSWHPAPDHIFETLEAWLRRPSLKLMYIQYGRWTWDVRFNANGELDPPGVWDRLIAIEDERLLVGIGFEEEFGCLTGDGEAVWDRVSESFGDWRVTVRLDERREIEDLSP